MKSRFISVFTALVCMVPAGLLAQNEAPGLDAEAVAVPVPSAEELEALLGPVALHPDALVALILPAATVPADIVLARRFLDGGGVESAIDAQPWDESVRALARYPELIKWLDDELEWTVRLGAMFVAQPAEVMNTIQRLRARAQAAGTLTSTPEQRVIVEREIITIVPVQPDVIYVPYYDPTIVYLPRRPYYHRPYVSFGIGFAVGSWLSFDCDWYGRRVWYSDRHRHRHDYRDWRHPRFPGQIGYVSHPYRNPWTPRIEHVRRFEFDRRNAPPVRRDLDRGSASRYQQDRSDQRRYESRPNVSTPPTRNFSSQSSGTGRNREVTRKVESTNVQRQVRSDDWRRARESRPDTGAALSRPAMRVSPAPPAPAVRESPVPQERQARQPAPAERRREAAPARLAEPRRQAEPAAQASNSRGSRPGPSDDRGGRSGRSKQER